MLTNKKNSIRVFALVLALLMAVAVFAGCSSDTVVEDEQARADAEAAKKAAEEAKASAESIAKDLADKLAALDKTLGDVNDSVNNVGDKVEQGDKDLQDQIDKWHNGETTTADPNQMTKPDQNEVTNQVSEKVLAQFTELKNKFLVTRETWYTTANYVELSKIFEEASFELYRVTTAEGVEALLAETETKANAVANIVSDAAAVQALIAQFGDVYANLTTSDRSKVETARAAFDKWVNDYAVCFFAKNGKTVVYDIYDELNYTAMESLDANGNTLSGEQTLVNFADKVTGGQIYINASKNSNGLRFAEWKLSDLDEYAEKTIRNAMIALLRINGSKTESEAAAIVDVLINGVKEGNDVTAVDYKNALNQFNVVKKAVEKTAPSYADCKKNGNANIIEEVYKQYRIFYNTGANNGDDSPISLEDRDGNVLLTGEQFVKLYVLCLYDQELVRYQNQITDFMNEYLVDYFLGGANNTANKLTAEYGAIGFNYEGRVTGYDSNGYKNVLKVTGDVITFKVEDAQITVEGANIDPVPATKTSIEKAFNRVLYNANLKVTTLDYSADFKGSKSLDDAFVEIEKIYTEAAIEMIDVYFEQIVTPVINSLVENKDDSYKAIYYNVDGKVDGTDYGNMTNVNPSAAYYAADNEFYTQVSTILTAARNAWTSTEFCTYEDLDAIEWLSDVYTYYVYNVGDQRWFDQSKLRSTDGVLTDSALTLLNYNYHSDKSFKGSAFQTVIDAARDTLYYAYLDYENVVYDLEQATEIHTLAINYAKQVDSLVGIATDASAKDADWKWTVEGKLMKTFASSKTNNSIADADAYYNVITNFGKTTGNFKMSTIYKGMVDARDTAVKDILSVKLLNDDGTLAIDKETYDAVNKDGEALYYDATTSNVASGFYSTTSKDRVALSVIVDPEVVAEYILLDKFKTGANAVLNAFVDPTRTNVKTSMTDAIESWRSNNYFGDLDFVMLENDMTNYLNYLNSLVEMTGVSFSTEKYSARNVKLDKDCNLKDKNGIALVPDSHTIDGKTYTKTLHVYQTVKTYADAFTAYWNGNAETALRIYFGMMANSGEWIDNGLATVQKLAYLKDSLLNDDGTNGKIAIPGASSAYSLAWIYKSFVGEKDKDGNLVVGQTGYGYSLTNQRTAKYLEQLEVVKNAVAAKIEAINILSFKYDTENTVNGGSHGIKHGYTSIDQAYAQAAAQLGSIIWQTVDAESDGRKAANSADDYSFKIAYQRYYAATYSWSAYEG